MPVVMGPLPLLDLKVGSLDLRRFPKLLLVSHLGVPDQDDNCNYAFLRPFDRNSMQRHLRLELPLIKNIILGAEVAILAELMSLSLLRCRLRSLPTRPR